MQKIVFVILWAMPIIGIGAVQDTVRLKKGLASESFLQSPKIKLSATGNSFIQFSGNTQVFLTTWQNNPGTALIGNKTAPKWDYNGGFRRTRLIINYQISPRWSALLSMGTNTYSIYDIGSTNPPRVQLLDVIIGYKVADWLHIGLGQKLLGVSRLGFFSSSKNIFEDRGVLDPEGMETDADRYFGLHLMGSISRFNYYVSVIKPQHPNGTSPNTIIATTEKNISMFAFNNTIEPRGYINYNFFDLESVSLGSLGTNYLGTKKLMSVGIGGFYRKQGTAYWNDKGNLVYNNTYQLSADFFMDMPINKVNNSVFTLYSVLYSSHFGKNFVNLGGYLNAIPNYYSSSLGGNTEPQFGTGTIWQTEVAYLFPSIGSIKGQIQLAGQYTLLSLEAYKNVINRYDLGLNYYYTSNIKLGLWYEGRPKFTTLAPNSGNRQKGILNQMSLFFQFAF